MSDLEHPELPENHPLNVFDSHVHVPEEALMHFVINLAYEGDWEGPSDTEWDDLNIEKLHDNAESCSMRNESVIEVEGRFIVAKKVGELGALPGRHKFDPPRAPPEPIMEQQEMEFVASIDLKSSLGGNDHISVKPI